MKLTRGMLYKIRADIATGSTPPKETVDAMAEALLEAVELPATITTTAAYAHYKWLVKWSR